LEKSDASREFPTVSMQQRGKSLMRDNTNEPYTYAYDHILKHLYDGLYFTDNNRKIIYWNKAAERISGFTAKEVIGRSCSDDILTHVDKDGKRLCKSGRCPLAASICDGALRESEVYMHHKDGHRIPVSVRVSQLPDEQGNIVGGIELFTDISSQKANTLRMRELEQMAQLDNLTQMANRNYLEQELEARHADYQAHEVPYGLLFIDIDHFKRFNDTYGHAAGDEVLRFVAATLTTNSRPFDVFGRWGGEEFLGIIRNIPKQELEIIGARLIKLVEASYLTVDSHKLQVTISVGATIIQSGDSVTGVVKRADACMYRSKDAGRNQLSIA